MFYFSNQQCDAFTFNTNLVQCRHYLSIGVLLSTRIRSALNVDLYVRETCDQPIVTSPRKSAWPLADLGGVPGARPPYGSRFFHFDIQNFRNVTASGVHAPPPPQEILDPPLMTQFVIFPVVSILNVKILWRRLLKLKMVTFSTKQVAIWTDALLDNSGFHKKNGGIPLATNVSPKRTWNYYMSHNIWSHLNSES